MRGPSDRANGFGLFVDKETLVMLGDTSDTQRVFVLDDEEQNQEWM